MHQLDSALSPAELLRQLDPRVADVVLACRTLYAGRWDDLAEDVRRRAAGRPYLFCLELGLEDLVGWAQRLRDYELARGELLFDALEDRRKFTTPDHRV